MCHVLRTLVLIVSFVCVSGVQAQQDVCQTQTIPVSISTKDGAAVPQLSAADFEAAYGRKPVRVTSAAINQKPTRVILLFDTSESMHGLRSEAAWNFAVDLGEDLVQVLPKTSEIGLGVFASKFVRIASPTNERLKLKTELEAIRLDSKNVMPDPRRTALWDAVLDSFKMLDPPRLGDAIYVITDGGDNVSGASPKHVAQILSDAGVRLFASVFQKDSGGISREEMLSPVDVLQIADETGGTIVPIHSEYRGAFLKLPDPALTDKAAKPTRLGLLLGSQYRQISKFYAVGIDLPATIGKRQQLKLGLAGLSKFQQDNFVLNYQHILMPCR